MKKERGGNFLIIRCNSRSVAVKYQKHVIKKGAEGGQLFNDQTREHKTTHKQQLREERREKEEKREALFIITNETTSIMDVEGECKRLILAIERISTPAENKKSCTFGALFRDDAVQNEFEALNGTLRAAKKRKMISFEGEMLLQGAHDDVVITVL